MPTYYDMSAYWAIWDSIDDTAEDELDREIRDGLMDWGRPE